MRKRLAIAVGVLGVLTAWAAAQETPEEIRAAADEAWQSEQYYEAARYYRRLPGAKPLGTDPELAVRLLRCRLRLEQASTVIAEADEALPRLGESWAAVQARRIAAAAAMNSFLEATSDDEELEDGWAPEMIWFHDESEDEEGAPLLSATEKNAQGLAHLEAARTLAEKLLAQTPADAKARQETLRTHLALIRMLERQGRDEVPPADRLDAPTPAMPYRGGKWTPTCKIGWLARRVEQLDDTGEGRFAAAALYRFAVQLHRMNAKRATPSAKWAEAPRFHEVAERWPKTRAAGAARYALGMLAAEADDLPAAIALWQALADDGVENEAIAVWSGRAQAEVRSRTAPVVSVQMPRPSRSGTAPKVSVQVANVGALACTVWKVQIPRTDEERTAHPYPNGWAAMLEETTAQVSSRLGAPLASWTHAVEGGKRMQWWSGDVPLPFTEPGVYAVVMRGEGRAAGGLCVITDLSVLWTGGRRKLVCATVDSHTGRPRPGVAVAALVWSGWGAEAARARLDGVTGEDGTLELALPDPGRHQNQIRVTAWQGDHIALTREARHQLWFGQEDHEIACFLETDRPIYRPGQRVQVKATWRKRTADGWVPAGGTGRVELRLDDPRGNEERVIAMEWLEQPGAGAAVAAFELPADALLGMWYLAVDADGVSADAGEALRFRVEEYRRPEFEVRVRPETPVVKFGHEAAVRVEAGYFSGEPLVGAEVSYTVSRTEHDGKYRSWWSPWWWWEDDEDGPAGGEVEVAEGVARTGPDGTVRITFPTRLSGDFDPARDLEEGEEPPDDLDRYDYEYFVNVEVTDAGRRTIEAEGKVWASPTRARVNVAPQAGHARAGEPVVVRVGARAPDGTPIAAAGKLYVERLTGADAQTAKAEVVQTLELAVPNDGEAEVRVTPERPGRYRLRAVLPDEGGNTSTGDAELMVTGSAYTGADAPLPELEVRLDRAVYARGATARALVVSRFADARVLLLEVRGDRILRWHWIAMPGRFAEVSIPCDAARAPNMELQVHLVREGLSWMDQVDLEIPAQGGAYDVQVTTDRPVYGPREQGTVTVQVRTAAGEPVAGVACSLGVIDRSLLAIQPELAPALARLFRESRIRHHVVSASSLEWIPQDWARGWLRRPKGGGSPPGWWIWMREGNISNRSGGIPGLGSDEGGALAFGDDGGGGEPPPVPEGPGLAQRDGADGVDGIPADVRRNFAETALWNPALVTDAGGRATASVTFPDSLTSWRVLARAIGHGGMGEAEAEVETTRPLIARLHSPRVCTERDVFVCSISAVNGLPEAADVQFELQVLGAPVALEGPPVQTHHAAPGTEVRADFRLRAAVPGKVWLVARVRAGTHGDAVAKPLPVRAHAVPMQRALVGVVAEPGTITLEAPLPPDREPGTTSVEVQLAPNLGGVVIGALPYLLEYPYGCAEQTTSRMLPAAILASVLEHNGVDLVAQREAREALPVAVLPDAGRASPLFDPAELEVLVRAGLMRLAKMQNPHGGWGWWGGDAIDPWMTAYVVHALQLMEQYGVQTEADMRQYMMERGLERLAGAPLEDLEPDEAAFVQYVLAVAGMADADDLIRLYAKRARLGMPARAMLALALKRLRMDEADAVADFLASRLEVIEAEGTASVKTDTKRWWWWGNDQVEANAWTLRAFLAVRPDDPNIDRLARWLVVNRQGSRWKSTRDTSLACIALLGYLGETAVDDPDLEVTVKLGDHAFAPVRFSGNDAWTGGHRFVLTGPALDGAGSLPLVVTTKGRGRCYFTVTAAAISRAEDLPAAGFQLHVERTYYRVKAVTKQTAGGPERVWERTPLQPGDTVQAGERLEVALELKSSVDLEYVAVIDPKATGFEPVDDTSGHDWWGDAHQELRDDRVCWFLGYVEQGRRTLRYHVRAEHPGELHGLPAQVFAMYAPRARGNSTERRHVVQDK